MFHNIKYTCNVELGNVFVQVILNAEAYADTQFGSRKFCEIIN